MSVLTEAMRQEIVSLFPRYPQKRSVLLPALHIVQRERGWIPPEAMEEVAALFDLRPVEVMEVVSFYTLFNRAPVGRHHIQVCRNIACGLRGARKITRHLSGKLGIPVGGTTPDGRFTLTEVECLGSCGTAPMLQCDEDYHENLTVERVDDLLSRLP